MPEHNEDGGMIPTNAMWLDAPKIGQPLGHWDICGSTNIHVYPADELADRMAACLTCGAHYHKGTGWLDPVDL